MLLRWNLTVASVTHSLRASSPVGMPVATSWRISCSPRVRPGSAAGNLPAAGVRAEDPAPTSPGAVPSPPLPEQSPRDHADQQFCPPNRPLPALSARSIEFLIFASGQDHHLHLRACLANGSETVEPTRSGISRSRTTASGRLVSSPNWVPIYLQTRLRQRCL